MSLTVRGIKTRLTRAGVDYSALTITCQNQTSRTVDIDHTGQWKRRAIVIVSGPREARRPASNVLFDGGLSCAPYPDRDEWML